MYQIFVNDKPIVLTTLVEQETNFKSYKLKTVNIEKVIKKLQQPEIQSIRLIGKNKNKLLKRFLKLLPNVIAGGGKVYNKKGKVLFIYRNGKWDLPKGKAESKETIKETEIGRASCRERV